MHVGRRPQRQVVHLAGAAALLVASLVGVHGASPVRAETPTPFEVESVVPVTPARIYETRSNNASTTYLTYDGRYNQVGRRGDDTVSAFKVRGRARIAVDADAVVLNVTAIGPDDAGFLTLYPCGQPRPLTSSVNYGTRGAVVANAVLVQVGNGGNVCVYNSSATDIAIDVAGFVPHQGLLKTVLPARVLETRQVEGFTTVDGRAQGGGRVAAESDTAVQIAGRAGVPTDAESVFVNVTAIAPDEPGFLTVYPCGSPRPRTSNVNYQAGQVVPNSALVRLGESGTICVYTLSAVDIVVDVSGYALPVATTETLLPARLLETRNGPENITIDGIFQGTGRAARDAVIEIPVAGRGGVPTGAQYALLNVTAVLPDRPGFLTVYPCDSPKPFASSVNFDGRDVRPNSVLAKLSATGTTCLYTTSATDLLVDVTGYGGFEPSPIEALRRALTKNAATTRGRPTIGVFTCLVPTTTTSADYIDTATRTADSPTTLAAGANQFVAPYFDAMSNGRFVPNFVAAGTITLATDQGRDACLKAAESQGDAYDLPVAFDNVPDDVNGQIGLTSIYTQGGAARPGGIWVSALTRVDNEWSTLSHELGHALFWRHSRSNDNFAYGDHYDVMGWTRDCRFASAGTPDEQCSMGQATQAFNRYASGWLDDDAVMVHAGGTSTYTIGAADSGASELLIAPSPVASQALTIETRVKAGYDVTLDRDGVIVRFVDGMERQMSLASSPPTSCFNYPPVCDRVLVVGDSATLNGVTIEVTARTASTFTMTVTGSYTGRSIT